MDDIAAAEAALRELTILPRDKRWTHLSLCVLDAVFSIGVTYTATERTVKRYAEHAGLTDPLLPAARVTEVVGTDHEQPLRGFVAEIQATGTERFAAQVLRNLQYTSAHPGKPRKAEAALLFASALTDHGVDTFGDLAAVLVEKDRREALEQRLNGVPGAGMQRIRLEYFWMVTGEDDLVKPDRMVVRWLRDATDVEPSPDRAREVLAELSRRTGHTAWEIDHAIWEAQRGRPVSRAAARRCRTVRSSPV